MPEFTSETSGGVSDPTANQRHWNFWKEKLGVPYFSNTTENVVLSTIGHTAYLHCLVGNLGDRQVNPILILLNMEKFLIGLIYAIVP